MANTYSSGTVSVTTGSKTVTISGGLSISINMKPGDFIAIEGGLPNAIETLTDATHFDLVRPFDGASDPAASYIVIHMPSGWGDRVELNEQTAENIRRLGMGIPTQEAIDAAIAASGVATTKAAEATQAAQDASELASKTYGTWAQLLASPGTREAQRAEVLNDAGTHTGLVIGTDTVASGVRNEGVYSWSTSPAGWRRVADTGVGSLTVEVEKKADKMSPVFTDNLTLDEVQLFSGVLGWLFGQSDSQDNAIWGVSSKEVLHLPQEIDLGAVRIRLVQDNPSHFFAVTDEFNNVLLGQPVAGSFASIGGSSADAGNSDLANLALRDQLQPLPVAIAAPIWDYNVYVQYGQSLAVNAETWPAKSKTPVPGTFMLGNATTPVSFASETYEPFGGNAFQPLVANVRSGTSILDDAAVAALTPGDQASGESATVAWLHGLRRLFDRRALATAAQRMLVTFSPGRGGETIEALSKGRPDGTVYYNRYTDGLSRISTLAAAASKSAGAVAISWLGGEANYSLDGVGETTKDGYKALLSTMADNMQADAQAKFGQTTKPLFITYQTGGAYTVDADSNGTPGLAIGMAQWELSRERIDVVMVGPIYHLTDKRDNADNGHLDANGARWYGEYLAKVTDFMQQSGRKWRPLEPVSVSTVGSNITVGYYVPVAPLRLQPTYDRSEPVIFADRGFRVTDSSGEVPISDVQIVGQTIIQITTSRAPDLATGRIWYADKTAHLGSGNVCDSDAAVGQSNYEYVEGSGDYPVANIPELVGKPYPLRNASIAFHLPLNWSI
jgi:hypothetical protein